MTTPEISERQRIAAILGSEAATRMPALAESLAFGTDLSAEAVGQALAAATADVEAARSAPKPEPQPMPSRRPNTSLAGIGAPEPTGEAAGVKPGASWDKAVGKANRDPADKHGWGRAKSYTKIVAA